MKYIPIMLLLLAQSILGYYYIYEENDFDDYQIIKTHTTSQDNIGFAFQTFTRSKSNNKQFSAIITYSGSQWMFIHNNSSIELLFRNNNKEDIIKDYQYTDVKREVYSHNSLEERLYIDLSEEDLLNMIHSEKTLYKIYGENFNKKGILNDSAKETLEHLYLDFINNDPKYIPKYFYFDEGKWKKSSTIELLAEEHFDGKKIYHYLCNIKDKNDSNLNLLFKQVKRTLKKSEEIYIWDSFRPHISYIKSRKYKGKSLERYNKNVDKKVHSHLLFIVSNDSESLQTYPLLQK